MAATPSEARGCLTAHTQAHDDPFLGSHSYAKQRSWPPPEAAKEATLSFKGFLEQFGLQEPDKPVALACDNQAAINLSYNPEHHKRVKHIARHHFFIREKVEENLIEVGLTSAPLTILLTSSPSPSRATCSSACETKS